MKTFKEAWPAIVVCLALATALGIAGKKLVEAKDNYKGVTLDLSKFKK